MQRDGVALNRKNYLAYAFLGQTPAQIHPEVEAEFPDWARE